MEHGRLDMVNLFLDNGADANHTIYEEHGSALFKAVKHKHHKMVEVLVQITDRISCTRTLALAAKQQDTTTANILLGQGVGCDFEESDRPGPPDPISWDHDSLLCRGLESEDITPPLVWATRLGNAALVAIGSSRCAVYNLNVLVSNRVFALIRNQNLKLLKAGEVKCQDMFSIQIMFLNSKDGGKNSRKHLVRC